MNKNQRALSQALRSGDEQAAHAAIQALERAHARRMDTYRVYRVRNGQVVGKVLATLYLPDRTPDVMLAKLAPLIPDKALPGDIHCYGRFFFEVDLNGKTILRLVRVGKT